MNQGVHRIETWQDFLARIATLKIEQSQPSDSWRYHSELLFRGQSDSTWKLESTVERLESPPLELLEYFAGIQKIKLELESRLDRQWTIPTFEEYRRLLDENDWDYPIPDQLYEFLVYLRHHGFPSPLLDWTRSPFIAAHFAFRNASSDGSVAIFAYKEHVGEGKSTTGGAPQIHSLGPNVRTHVRHYLQQSEYSVAISGNGSEARYCPHDLVLEAPLSEPQDLLWKFELPGALKVQALRYLHSHNLTDYSLFGTEESLMATLAARVFLIQR